MSFHFSPRIITDSLVLYLDAGNTRSYPGSGVTWTDLSRGGNNGVLTNGPTFNSGNGGSIVFDGSNDYIQTTNINLTNTNAVSVDFWCKLNSYTEVIGAGKVLVEFSTNFNSSLTGFLVAIADDSNALYGNTFPITLNLRGNMAEVQMGMLTLSVPVIDLEVTKEPIQTNARKSVETSGVSRVPFDKRIDLREYTKQDALRLLQEFLDRALLHHAYELKIIHGYGTGVMKKEVWKMLREYKDIKKYWHPEHDAGGEGVTIVQF